MGLILRAKMKRIYSCGSRNNSFVDKFLIYWANAFILNFINGQQMVTKYLTPKITKSHSIKKSEIFCYLLNFEINFRKRKSLRKRRVYAGFGADSRTRTDDLLITNELLYQLSHISISGTSGGCAFYFLLFGTGVL